MQIRPATPADVPALGRLGAHLMRVHHDFDPQRFLSPGSNPEEGYAWFLGRQLEEPDSVVLVAEHEEQIVGYVYAGIEPLSWRELRDEAGFVHDIVVAPGSTRQGAGKLLLAAALDWLRGRGAARAMLWTAQQNESAQRLFEGAGFRRTMIEMTREL